MINRIPREREEERDAEQRRKDDNLRWLEEHNDWRPLGVEW